MANLGKTQRAEKSQAVKYLAVGEALHRTARDLSDLGEIKYGNATAIVAIHAAIAYTDALTIAYGELKSRDGDHAQAAEVLQYALRSRADAAQVKRLRGILNTKSNVSYSGTYYTIEDAREILEKVDEFGAWARTRYEERPA